MAGSYVGEMCALAAAVSWAVAVVLFKRCGEQVSPLALNLFKNVVALVLLAGTLIVFPQGIEKLQHLSPTDFAILIVSGLLGIALADTLLFHSLNLIGVGLISIVECLYSPLIILFAFLLLAENITVGHFVGIGFIVAGVFISSGHAPPADRTRGQLVLGILVGSASMLAMTFGIVLAKPVLEMHDFPLLWATTFRMMPATLALVLVLAVSPQRARDWAVFRPSSAWKTSVPASILGGYLSMLLWMGGFKYAKASVAGILNQTSVIFAIILATIILKEPFTRRKLAAVVFTGTGVVIVTLSGS